MSWRSRKLLDHIHDSPVCYVCYCHGDGTNIVPAHSNQLRDGKGKGIKADDYRVAALCHKCHMELDQGKNWSANDKHRIWEEAHRSTIGWLIETGRLEVSDAKI